MLTFLHIQTYIMPSYLQHSYTCIWLIGSCSFLTPKQLEHTHIRSYIQRYEFSEKRTESASEVFKMFPLPPNQSIEPPPDVSIVDTVDRLVNMCEDIGGETVLGFDCECNNDNYMGTYSIYIRTYAFIPEMSTCVSSSR